MKQLVVPRIIGNSIQKHGFTLTEIALVLGIIGLILGAIWIAASTLYNNLRVSQATKQLLYTTQMVKSMYATTSTVDPGANMQFGDVNVGTQLTYIRAGVFPSDTINAAANEALNPWSGSLSVQSQATEGGAAPNAAFSVSFDQIPLSACIQLLTENAGVGMGIAVEGVSVKSAGTIPYCAGCSPSNGTWGPGSFPLAASSVATKCSAAGPLDAVAFLFYLKE